MGRQPFQGLNIRQFISFKFTENLTSAIMQDILFKALTPGQFLNRFIVKYYVYRFFKLSNKILSSRSF